MRKSSVRSYRNRANIHSEAVSIRPIFGFHPGGMSWPQTIVREAVERTVDHAIAMGATTVTGVRLESSDIGDGIVEIVAYGTAVSL